MTSYNGKNGIEQSIIDHSSQVDFSTTMIVVFAYLCTLTLWYYGLVLPPAYYLLPLFLQQYIMNTRYCFRSKVVIHEDGTSFFHSKKGVRIQFFREINFIKKMHFEMQIPE